ncbi:hypothetical protein [Paenibacillus sp. AD87]|uniref:hypothetical protein n=1 Tax=Paenibacillus sp. AD87 TaxID=1528787 RepID=UPI0007E34D1C|nr:hypothetical protein [Paenibacillus sp. AD87]OAX50841.1 hypothetical protein gpAD87_21790 [Paenibacillus sp. AD87]
MKKKMFFLLLVIVLVTSAVIMIWFSGLEPSAYQVENDNDTNSSGLYNKASSLPNIIEIMNEEATLQLPLNDVPEYKRYLMNEQDFQTEIDRTQLEVLEVPSSETYSMLKYGCGTKACSTLLVKIDGRETHSLPMPEGILQDYKLSSDYQQVLIRYAYDEGGLVKRQILVAVDLKKLEIIPYASTDLEEAFMLKPTWPIISYEWIDNNHFTIETAALETSEYNVLKDWFDSNDRETRKVTIRLNSLD